MNHLVLIVDMLLKLFLFFCESLNFSFKLCFKFCFKSIQGVIKTLFCGIDEIFSGLTAFIQHLFRSDFLLSIKMVL